MCLDLTHKHRHHPQTASQLPAQAVEKPAPPAPRRGRRKLWELPHKLHCPVIGTCLSAAELRRLAAKLGAQPKGQLSDYQVHVSFVSSMDDRNPISLAAHKALEKKYAVTVRQFARARSSEQLGALWDRALARGEVAPALWATLTHPQCDNALRMRSFEEVHMLSHQIGAGQRADLERLHRSETELARLQRDFDAQQRRTRHQLEQREAQLRTLQEALHTADGERRQLQSDRQALHQQLSQLQTESGQQQRQQLTRELAACRRQLAEALALSTAQCRSTSDAERRVARLEAERGELRQECAAMERFISQSLSQCDTCEQTGCDGSPDLGGRRILCVGGRNRLVEQYRDLVARCNGRFEHHDGGIEDNRQRLDALLSSADAVVCATDAVSHDAYYRLKRFCKRSRKPHVFLRSSGISTFTRAICHISG